MARRAVALAGVVALLLAVVACGGGDGSKAPRTLRVAIGNDPASLDPGRGIDPPAADVIYNLGDPLVRLGKDYEAVPSLARSWEWSADGKTIAFHLRDDGRWTNGDPVTADDFEWSWKRLLSPELGAGYAYQLYGIAGARAYNQCTKECGTLRDKVGVIAIDDYTLRVRLRSPQPWFPQQVVHQAFLAVHRPTVERFPRTWTDPKHIVTNGPFRLASWTHDKSLVLVKDEGWRDANDVWLDRVVFPVIPDAAATYQAFRRGAVDATAGDLAALADQIPAGSREKATYPLPLTFYYGFNLKNIPDLNQRRAMAFAIDRQALSKALGALLLPATAFIPPGMPGFDRIAGDFLPQMTDLEKARAYMQRARNPKRRITLFLNDAPDIARTGEIARESWGRIGIETKIKILEWAQFLDAVGPPPRSDVDVVHMGWIADYLDPYNFFQILSCDSENNNWNFCDPAYERLVRQASRTPDPESRYPIYAQLEARITGPRGLLPIIPVHWSTINTLEEPSIRGTFNVDPLFYVDLTAVRPK
jgi:oligopeptide transport system substrate-binding protein